MVHGTAHIYPFRDLPKVPTARDGHSFVYLKDKTMYWTPESTSISLKLKIHQGSPSPKTCYKNCDYYTTKGSCCHIWDKNYKVESLWNHLVIVFHLPNGYLNVPKKQLLKNLKACNISKPPLLPENEQLELKKAKESVQKMKRMKKDQKKSLGIRKRKGSSEVQNGNFPATCINSEYMKQSSGFMDDMCQTKCRH